MEEHLYIVSYDIRDSKRWRRVFRLMNGYGEWLQLSVFQCRLSGKQRVQLLAQMSDLIDYRRDHVMVLDLGPADAVRPRVKSLGKKFRPVRREPVIV
ncbi:MAG: CRISPR-associated endonuclease Cas2 [Gammaproteobacteria bacterium]|nr:CRISPR-associated endonuclease Cas2 [Gammaproteobacteria bacterium]